MELFRLNSNDLTSVKDTQCLELIVSVFNRLVYTNTQREKVKERAMILKKKEKKNNDIEIQSTDLPPTKRKNILMKDIMYIFPNKKK